GVFINGNTAAIKETTASLKAGLNKIDIAFDIDNPKLWWTHGLGEAYQYDVQVKLMQGNDVIDQLGRRVGIRTIKLVQKPDTIGTSFYFEVNGIPVFMKGSNYIPPDNLNAGVGVDRYKNVIKAATDANMNMLRVWGGAIYEDDVLYELCDENGILVWQDFMFACSMYPGDKEYLDNVRLEAEENVKRLRNHPSLALWCGNNENLVAWHKWGWQKEYKISAEDSATIWHAYEKTFYDILPNAVKKYNSQIAYWPSSPSSSYYELPNTKSGDAHYWDVWFGSLPLSSYNDSTGRFISEYGLQSFPAFKTYKSFTAPEDWDIHSALTENRQRSNMKWIAKDFNGNDMIERYIAMEYKKPKDFKSLIYVSQLLQSLAVKTAIESHRRKMPYCMGSLYWQIDDCWPTMSWSSMDYYFRWKALHYDIKKAFSEILVSPIIEKGIFKVYIVSDKLEPVDATLRLKLMDLSGKELLANDFKVTIKANGSQVYFSIPESEILKGVNKNKVLLSAEVIGGDKILADNIFYFTNPKNLTLTKPVVRKKIARINNGYSIELSSSVLAKDIYLSSENTEGFFTDNYFDLLPGKKVTIEYISDVSQEEFEKDLQIISLIDSY
ncbi:MAG: hypothetical protein K2X86_13835, partial [Cytophagaceae bacterium]|nr:hypothetical protein [Cytophagaceae bacterium]